MFYECCINLISNQSNVWDCVLNELNVGQSYISGLPKGGLNYFIYASEKYLFVTQLKLRNHIPLRIIVHF